MRKLLALLAIASSHAFAGPLLIDPQISGGTCAGLSGCGVPPPSGTAIQKANNGGPTVNAVAGTDYAGLASNNTFTGTNDFTSGILIMTVSAGYAPTVAGRIGLNSTNKGLVWGDGTNTDTVLPISATNDNAPAGALGEIFSSCIPIGSAVALTNNTTANITSISPTAGDWDIEGNGNFTGTSATITGGQAAISSTSATLPTDGSEAYDGTVTTALSDKSTVTLPRKRASLASTTPYYLVAQKSFSAGTVSAFGCITARRVR